MTTGTMTGMTVDEQKARRVKVRRRNMMAKALRENKEFRLRRVEDNTKLYERKSTKDILREAREEY